jgi:hypothetical protein
MPSGHPFFVDPWCPLIRLGFVYDASEILWVNNKAGALCKYCVNI